MKIFTLFLIFSVYLVGCEKNMEINNKEINSYKFLDEMYSDNYFPKHLVEKGEKLLLNLCIEIETKKPKTSNEVYKLTHATTIKFNELAVEFENQESEIETSARDNIGTDVEFILKAYGYNLDTEEAIAPREW